MTTKEVRPDTPTLHLAVASLQRAMWPNSCVTWSGILVKSHLRQYGFVCTQAHVHQLAIAAGDMYVRMYDRRMLSTGEPLQACAWPAGRHTTYTKNCDSA